MKERPILFSGPMVRAILDGRKTQTRRVVKGEALRWLSPEVGFDPTFVANPENGLCPYGGPGGRLWVRETFCVEEWRELFSGRPTPQVHYRAGWQGRSVMTNRVLPDGTMEGPVEWCEPQKAPESKWRPSIFMPRWASRITLEVTGVRVQRVQDISEEDAGAEGTDRAECIPWPDGDPGTLGDERIRSYVRLWDSINGKRPGCAWADNPWVWVVEFKRLP